MAAAGRKRAGNAAFAANTLMRWQRRRHYCLSLPMSPVFDTCNDYCRRATPFRAIDDVLMMLFILMI